MNQDVLTGSLGNSQSLNRYSYVQGNPVSYTDPFGLSPLAGLFTGTTLIHLGLGILGCVPVVGFFANMADAAVYAYVDHDYFSASMALLDCATMGATGMCSLLRNGSMLRGAFKCFSIAGDFISNTINFAIMGVNMGLNYWNALDDKEKATAIVCTVAGVTLVAGGFALGSYIKHKKVGAINPNWEAHNVVNYAKLKEQYRVRELANDVIDSLKKTGTLPNNYITKQQARALGWSRSKALHNYAPGMAIGGDIFNNSTGILPNAKGRTWFEADIGIDYKMSRANPKNPGYRILYSNDGLIYGTFDHYDSVFQIFP